MSAVLVQLKPTRFSAMNPLFMGMSHKENPLLPVIWMSFVVASERFTAKFVPRRSTNDLDLHLIGNNLKPSCLLGRTRNSMGLVHHK